jgi:hypothetical protein
VSITESLSCASVTANRPYGSAFACEAALPSCVLVL